MLAYVALSYVVLHHPKGVSRSASAPDNFITYMLYLEGIRNRRGCKEVVNISTNNLKSTLRHRDDFLVI